MNPATCGRRHTELTACRHCRDLGVAQPLEDAPEVLEITVKMAGHLPFRVATSREDAIDSVVDAALRYIGWPVPTTSPKDRP